MDYLEDFAATSVHCLGTLPYLHLQLLPYGKSSDAEAPERTGFWYSYGLFEIFAI